MFANSVWTLQRTTSSMLISGRRTWVNSVRTRDGTSKFRACLDEIVTSRFQAAVCIWCTTNVSLSTKLFASCSVDTTVSSQFSNNSFATCELFANSLSIRDPLRSTCLSAFHPITNPNRAVSFALPLALERRATHVENFFLPNCNVSSEAWQSPRDETPVISCNWIRS